MIPGQPLNKLIGRYGYTKVGPFKLLVKIVDVTLHPKSRMTGFIVTPHGGEGRKWINPKKLTLMVSDR